MIRLSEIAKLKPWLERSKTFASLFVQCRDIRLDDTSAYREDEEPTADIYLPFVSRLQKFVRADDIAVLSHELEHAVQDHSKGGVWGEHDAYRIQAIVIEELKAAGFKVSRKWHPLSAQDIDHFYKQYYDET